MSRAKEYVLVHGACHGLPQGCGGAAGSRLRVRSAPGSETCRSERGPRRHALGAGGVGESPRVPFPHGERVAGRLYSREVLSQKQRELCAVAALTVLHREDELRLHIHAARNVGATREEIAEVIFQMLVYGGAPVMVEGLKVAKRALQERGEWKE